ncbi:bacterioferritin [Kutzneria viridogrisea]|uniref:Bacterioferritin n=1 Tax=Kutzneria viridogrisea TaxID=47990 RepID=A0ABR6BCE9_9PSEU|nr:bacterioferritin [Kutzneria viridogrisea]
MTAAEFEAKVHEHWTRAHAAAMQGQLAEVLDTVLAIQAACFLRYNRQAMALTGIGRPEFAARLREHARREIEYALRVARRLNDLGGHSEFDANALVAEEGPDGADRLDPDRVAEENRVARRVVVTTYQDILGWIGQGDPVTRHLIESILDEERST